jgi:hypothetical protein
MDRDIALMKFAEAIQFIEETMKVEKITGVELEPVPFANDNIYMTGFRIDTETPMIHLKVIRKLNLFNTTKQQKEYYMMNPDADFWIDTEALDGFTLSETITALKRKLYMATDLCIANFSYSNGNERVEQHVAYTSRRVACKDLLAIRKKHMNVKFYFTNKNTVSDLEFATAALTYEE